MFIKYGKKCQNLCQLKIVKCLVNTNVIIMSTVQAYEAFQPEKARNIHIYYLIYKKIQLYISDEQF